MKKAIYPGSFDPITNGHIDVIKKALDVFDEVVVLVANNPSKASRFTVSQRVTMIKDSLKDYKNVKVDSTDGMTVDYANRVGIDTLIRGLRNVTDYNYESKLAEEYHKMDSNIKLVFFLASEENTDLSSSKVDSLFKNNKDISQFVPDAVNKMYQKK